MRSRGEGNAIEDWYSICSRHIKYDAECPLCQKGRWINRLESQAEHELFERDPKEWRRRANLPDNPGRRFLESVFPGLRGKDA